MWVSLIGKGPFNSSFNWLVCGPFLVLGLVNFRDPSRIEWTLPLCVMWRFVILSFFVGSDIVFFLSKLLLRTVLAASKQTKCPWKSRNSTRSRELTRYKCSHLYLDDDVTCSEGLHQQHCRERVLQGIVTRQSEAEGRDDHHDDDDRDHYDDNDGN